MKTVTVLLRPTPAWGDDADMFGTVKPRQALAPVVDVAKRALATIALAFLCACGPLPNLSLQPPPCVNGAVRDENPAILRLTPREPVQLMASWPGNVGPYPALPLRVGGEASLELKNDGCGDPVELVDWQLGNATVAEIRCPRCATPTLVALTPGVTRFSARVRFASGSVGNVMPTYCGVPPLPTYICLVDAIVVTVAGDEVASP